MQWHHACMELQQLRYVIAVAEERNFTRAAARCFVVQSALSHQIKALERELGVILFARTSRRVELTAAGEAFLTAARQSVEAAERAVTDATAATTGHLTGELLIGMIPTVTVIDIPATLRDFRERHPGVQIRLRGGSSDEFLPQIRDGLLDVAVLGLAETSPPQRVASQILARERHVAVVGAEHRLASRRRLRLSELADETFVDFPAGGTGRIPTDAAFAAAGLHREVTFEASAPDMILDLVRHGLAVTLLPPAVVPVDPALRTIPVTGGPVRVTHLAWSDFNPSPTTLAFLELAQHHLDQT